MRMLNEKWDFAQMPFHFTHLLLGIGPVFL